MGDLLVSTLPTILRTSRLRLAVLAGALKTGCVNSRQHQEEHKMAEGDTGTLEWLCANHKNQSLIESLVMDPETGANQPNHKMRQVRSGHYVLVRPTPLPQPYLVAVGPSMAADLGLTEAGCHADSFIRFFGGDSSAAEEFQSWCTPYALSIFGKEMVQQCPFKNGNGYGDGRAISIAEVLTASGQRWEMQLKGAGPTPFCRGADGRAVLRSSVREFLAQEAMHSMGVCTTRSLSLVASNKLRVDRQWYSDDRAQPQQDLPDENDPRLAHMPIELRRMLIQQLKQQGPGQDPDVVVREPCAMTCRVAPSFLRVGQMELFGRRARNGENLEQLVQIAEHALAREYPEANEEGAPLQQRVLKMLELAANKFQTLTANWLRVGFAQGNFNSDNCLIGGRTMDYGPFGFVEKYRDDFALWVGSGDHFAFINQPKAGFVNFTSLVTAVTPLLDDQGKQSAAAIKAAYTADAAAAVNDVWRRKLGFGTFGDAHAELWSELHDLMNQTAPDFTILFRQMASCHDASDAASVMQSIQVAFYDTLREEQRQSWMSFVQNWLELIKTDTLSAEERGCMMKAASPKYVPREWMLMEAYQAAEQGDFEPLKRMHHMFTHPYEELPEMEERYYKRCPPELLSRGGLAFMT